MLYRIFNRIFGWQYVYWEDSCDSEIRRIHFLPNGRAGFFKYGKWWREIECPREVRITVLTKLKQPTKEE
jgi:hypothetical protein